MTVIGRRCAAPPRRAASSSDEAFVVAHHQLRLDLLHRLDDDADHDQEAGAAEARSADRSGTRTATSDGGSGHDAEEQGAGERDPGHDPGEVVLRSAGPAGCPG